jgi:dipeptidyl aminopeptidase/acylaminoacyl peptidase
MRFTMRVAAAAVGLWAGAGVALAAQAPSVRDLVRQVRLSDPRLSPDGRTVAVVETRADLESDEFRSEIVLVDLPGGNMRPLTRRVCMRGRRAGHPAATASPSSRRTRTRPDSSTCCR